MPSLFRVIVVASIGFCAQFSAATAADRQRAEHITLTVPYSFDYLLYLPPNYDRAARERWPLVLFLHGAGERGDNLEAIKQHGLPKLIAAGREFPFIVVSPQCPADTRWEIQALETLIDEIARTHRVDADRIYVTGLSMGGFGTWSLAQRRPERYAAVVPICGGGDPRFAVKLKHLPIWAFHGARDDVVRPIETERMIQAIRDAGGSPRHTVYPDAGHDAWTQTYENEELYTWLLAQRRPARPQM